MENPPILSTPERTTKAASCGVSVAMATYNGEKYIFEQLESIAGQSVLPAEIVITDDGSSDRTVEIVQQFASTAPFPVKLFRNEERLGYTGNFLKACGLCSQQIIAFCDQDDKWMGNKLETCVKAFEDPEVLLCVHSGELWYGTGRSGKYDPRFQKRRTFPALSAYPLQTHSGYAMVIRKALLEITDNSVRPISHERGIPLGHDQWVWFLAAVFGSIVVLPDVLCFYRQHDKNLFGGSARSLNKTLSLAMKPRSYADLSTAELYFADFLRQMALPHSAPLRARLDAAVSSLTRRAHLNTLRSQLYGENSNVLQRLQVFGKILFHGGYLPGRGSARIGMRAAFKDFVFGVPGIHKRLWASS